MIHDGRLYVDNSLLSDAAKCSTKLVLRHIYGMTTHEESAALKSGSAGHEALATFFKGGTIKEAMKTLRLNYKAWAEETIDPDDKYLGRFSWENVRKVVKYWMQNHPMSSMPFTVKPEHVEVGISYPLTKDGSIVFCGRMDAGPVEDKSSGNLYVLDHKYTGQISPGWLKGFRMASQLTGYIWGVEQHTPVTVIGAYINAIQLSKLPGLDDPTRKCRDPDHGGVTYEECQHLHVKSEFTVTQRSRQQVKEWKRSALKLAHRYGDWRGIIIDAEDREGVQKVPQEGMFSGSCTWCEFHDFCHTGRTHWKMLIHDPWKPYDVSGSSVVGPGKDRLGNV